MKKIRRQRAPRFALVMLALVLLAPLPAWSGLCSGICLDPEGQCPSCGFRFIGGALCFSDHQGDECWCAEFACSDVMAPPPGGAQELSHAPAAPDAPGRTAAVAGGAQAQLLPPRF